MFNDPNCANYPPTAVALAKKYLTIHVTTQVPVMVRENDAVDTHETREMDGRVVVQKRAHAAVNMLRTRPYIFFGPLLTEGLREKEIQFLSLFYVYDNGKRSCVQRCFLSSLSSHALTYKQRFGATSGLSSNGLIAMSLK